MEKKNNQMVDKEKELKNVAPDTDVAPDVTDASSFQGGPSHTSSNRQQMRLINRIDYYKWKINLLTELISVERENLEKSRDNRTGAFKERQRRKIFPLKLKASDVDEAVEELYGRDIEKFDKRQKLNFREYRQNLRRAEGLLNTDGTLKRFELDAEGNEIPFEAKLSAESEELLKAFEVSQAEQRAAFIEGLRVKAVAAVGEGAADAEDIYEAARLEDETALESFVAEENSRIEKRMEKYVEATQQKINRYNEKLLSMQEKLAELMAEEEAKFGVELPADVILRLDRLIMEFGGLKAVNNLSFDVKKGEIFGLIGPNGAGKTTVFNCITQFYKPTGGLIYYRNREDKVIVLNKYQVHDVIKTGIVRTFQNVEVIYELSILDNLLIAAHTQYKSNIFAQMFNTKGVRQEEAVNRKKALKVLEYCGLLDKKDLPPVGLPYGVLKRIELARTLMAGASLIILDEPAAGLNDNETIELAQMIRRIRDEFNVTIFLVEHDMGLVMDICEHICAISFGKKLAYGTPQEIQANPVVQEAYLGTNEVKKEAQNG
ncbi:MAG: ABC transporter ATP-binding protein [Lachnospiraceae bacterium]